MFGQNVQIKILAPIFIAGALGACGKANSNAPTLDPVRGKHPSSWVYGHRAYYQSNKTQCNECHGSDLKGGITNIGCFNASGDTRCHQGGHGPRTLPHAIPFLDKTLHGPAARADLIYCQACHGEPGVPETTPPYPRYNLPFGNLPHGCETCHPANAGHPAPWPGHRLAGGDLHGCGICHGKNLQGGTGDACSSCHPSLASGAVPAAGGCVSCHGKPPNGGPEAAAPNRSGAHAKHGNLSEVTGKCETCHTGGGTGTAKHANGQADLGFLSSYNAKTGTASYSTTTHTCTNVSCHGGKETPSWGSGSIDTYVSEGCKSCHTFGTAQFNSFSSGKHKLHYLPPVPGGDLSYGISCTECHDVNYLKTIHFSHLSTPGFDVPAKNTIRAAVGYNGTTCLPSPTGGSFSLGVCHFNPTVPRQWR